MDFSLTNRVALVTGSSMGLGKSIAFALGQAGARVAFNYYHNESRAEATFDAFKATGATGVLVTGRYHGRGTCAAVSSAG